MSGTLFKSVQLWMASNDTNSMIYLLCWNRGTENRNHSKPVWDSYWDKLDPKPDIVFLQEEKYAKRGSNNLFDKDQGEYMEYTNCPEAVVVVKSTFVRADLNLSQFVYNSLVSNTSDVHSMKSDKEFDEFTNPISTTLKNILQFFPKHTEDYIESGCTEFKTKLNNNQVDHASSSNTTTLDIIKEFKDRICMVPLNVQGFIIVAVSFHARSKISDKGRKITNVFRFLDELGNSTHCCAIVMGGDFNIDLHDGIDLCGFIVPPYDPTVHRAMHGKGYMCIDFFAYKNFSPDVGVEIKDVCSKMIIKCPCLVLSDLSGEFHVSLEQYNNDDKYKELRRASNHDPLQATLTLLKSPHTPPRTPQASPGTPHLWSSTKFNSSKKRPNPPRPTEDIDLEADDEEEDEDEEKDNDVERLQQGLLAINLSSTSNKKPSTRGT